MTSRRSVVEQFGPAASDYATFSYHADGPDLAPMLVAGELNGSERVLDIGCGPGHAALLFATKAREVVALDPTRAMLDEARRLADDPTPGSACFRGSWASPPGFPRCFRLPPMPQICPPSCGESWSSFPTGARWTWRPDSCAARHRRQVEDSRTIATTAH